jgi:twitching motility protein PilT
MSEAFLHQLLTKALAAGATDVHLEVGQPPGGRVRGELVFFKADKVKPEDTEAALRVLLGEVPERSVGIGARGGGFGGSPPIVDDALPREDAVFAYVASGIGRFRVSVFRHEGAVALVMRSVPHLVPTPAAIGLPQEAIALVEGTRRLVVLAGAPSSGRSTTAAAIVGYLNETRACHIVTFEDPIEHLHEPHRASIAQRAIGTDVPSVAAGLRFAARKDPDVLFAADLNSSDALDAALDAADRSLVVAVVAARGVPRAVARLSAMARRLDDGPARLAAALGGVVAQRLVPSGQTLAALFGVLTVDDRVREALRRAHDESAAVELGRLLREHSFE